LAISTTTRAASTALVGLPGNGLREVLGGEDHVGDGQLVVERHARHAGGRLVGHQLEVVGLAADDAAQRHQRVVAAFLRHRLQRDGDLQRAGHQHVLDVLGLDAQFRQLRLAGQRQRIGDGRR
jgi:hypothetical protein